MRGAILEVRRLVKDYGSFCLGELDFSVPKGCITGLAGENGAGKTTLIKAVLGMIPADKGEITVFGKDLKKEGKEIREHIGSVFGGIALPDHFTAAHVEKMYRGVYRTFDEGRFRALTERLRLDPKKKLKAYSRGMKVKLAITGALSHDARLLLLDEPFNELDPVSREELLELIREFALDEEHSVLVSSHLITDMEKIADYVALLKKGQLVFVKEKDRLMEQYAVIKGPWEELEEMERQGSRFVELRKNSFGAWGLADREGGPLTVTGRAVEEPASMEEILVSFMRGGVG